MRLTLGTRTYDLSSPAMVVGAQEVSDVPGPGPVRLPTRTTDQLERCAAAGAAVIVPSQSVDAARAAGLPPDRMAPTPCCST